jgi:Cft2 family RNA processing exonuclease
MQLRFVGCGDTFGSGGRFNTCFHVSSENVNVLIDCGASSLPALKRFGVARDEIDLVLITHFSRRPFRRPAVSAARRAVHAPHPPAGDRRPERD